MRLRKRIPGLIAVAVLAATAGGAARAVPGLYDFQAGSLTLTGTVGGSLLVDPFSIALDGVQATADTAANQLVSIMLTSTGPF